MAADDRNKGSRAERLVHGPDEALAPDRARGEGEEVAYIPDPLDERELTPPNAEPHPIKRLPGAEQVKRNTVEALIFRALSTPLAFGLTILQARALGPSGTGKYALAILTVTLFVRILSDLGNAATREVGDDGERLGPLTALAIRLCIIFTPIGVLATLALTYGPSLFGGEQSVDIELALLAAVALAPNIIRQTMSGILVGLSEVRLWSYLQIAPSVLSFLFFLVLVTWLDYGVRGAILGWALSHTITAAAALYLTRAIWLPHLTARIPRSATVSLLKLALAMGAVNVIIFVNYRIEFEFIEFIKGAEDVGYYRTATQVAESLWIVTTAIATASWTSVMHEREDRAVALVLRSSIKGILFMGIGAAALAVLAPTILPEVFGEDFEPSVSPLMWLLPGILAYGPVSVLSIFVSVRHRRPNLALIGPVLSIFVTAGLAYPLINEYGVDGAAMAASAGYIVSALAAWIMFIRLAGLTWSGRRRVAPGTA
jgi:O-antigen/teichoic acid export membrane protein